MRIPLVLLIGAAFSGSLLAQNSPTPAISTHTAHLTAATSLSPPVVAPGAKVTLIVDVTPKKSMHVYAPEQTDYIPVSLKLRADPAIKVLPPRFPSAERLFFEPLNETQRVYSKPFRILQPVTLLPTPALRERARAAGASLVISGVLHYQACDDAICYAPVNVPLTWTVSLRPAAR